MKTKEQILLLKPKFSYGRYNYSDVIEAMEEYTDQYKSQWIPVTEPPEIDKCYLLALKNGDISFDKCLSDGKHSSFWKSHSSYNVTHYMPLPKKPQN